jgi:hypothetical protein
VGDAGDRKVGAVFGLLGAVLLALDGLLDLARGVLYLALGRGGHAFAPVDQGLILLVVGLIVGFFSVLGGLRPQARATVAGAVLVVIAIVGWLALGLGSDLFAILGTVLVLVAGVVFLVAGR